MQRGLATLAAVCLAPSLPGAQVQYGPPTRYDGNRTEVNVSVPARAGGAGTYCFQVRSIAEANGIEVPSDWSDARCAPLVPPVTITLAWDAVAPLHGVAEEQWVHVAYEVRVGLAAPAPRSDGVLPDASLPESAESAFGDARPALDYQEKRAYELGVRFVASRNGRIIAVRFWKGANETGPHIGRVWSSAGQLLAVVEFANETKPGWQQQQLPRPVPVKANAAFVVSVTSDASGYYVVTPDALRLPLTRGSLRAEISLFGAAGSFPRTRRPHNFFRDVIFVPDS